MKVTTYENAAHLQETFAALRAQMETVLATEDSAERYDDATGTAICVTRGLSDTLRIYSLTASGYERRFAIKADGEVIFYQVDGFAFRVLEAWAQEVTQTPQPTPPAPVASVRSQTAPCAFHKAIRRCYAIAKDCGLNVKDEPAMRRAFGRALGHNIESRDELNGNDWQAVGDMMKRGALAW